MELRVEEDGKSECQPVTGWIGIVALMPTSSHAKAGRLPSGLLSRENLRNRHKETKQMTVEQTTGAVSHEPVGGWHSIDWQAAHENVRRLQARIVKATQAGKWNKVKALQRLLTRSYSAQVLAVRRVTENQGKNTPGVDGEIWDTPQQKTEAVGNLRHRGYRPLPLRRVYIDKANGKKRPLGIPTMKDRAMQALHLLALDPVAETTADRNSYGFRKERACADAIGQSFVLLAWGKGAQWILEGDIKSCFDQISHEWLLHNIPMEKPILTKWLKAGYIWNDQLYPTEAGTPQGGIISPVLANMALDGLEKQLNARFPKQTKRGNQAKVNYIRYADDFIVTGSSREILEQEVRPLIESFLAERGLQLSQEKTLVTHIEQGFDFLGQNVRKYNGKLLIKPAKKNIKRFLENIRQIIRDHKQISAGNLILLLNRAIQGWVNYHRHIVSKTTFAKVDRAIFEAIWRWACRRHPNKGKRWIRDRYFKTEGNRQWVFYGEYNGKEHLLIRASDTPIRRHTKIQGEANPYDPAWEMYFEKRLSVKMLGNIRGRKQLLSLWKEQSGICPVCNQPITQITGWHNHHIIWRLRGGTDKADNRVLLHPTCHLQVHSRDLYVEKPRPKQIGRS
jgi:RNA-directed DNA polymerase